MTTLDAEQQDALWHGAGRKLRGRVAFVTGGTRGIGAAICRSLGTQLATVENADRLGELALVTGESRVGQTKTLFYNTLFDENATSHIAYGFGLPYCFDG